MAINQILPFGTGAGANVMTPADYTALAARATGFQSGVAKSKEVNTPLRQSAFVAAMIGSYIAEKSGSDVLDNGDLTALQASFVVALSASPALTGTPTTPTASAGDKSTRIASTAFVANELVRAGHGQCRLAVVSGTSLRLSPYNGTGLIINGVQAQVPSAGVTITNSGLTANTLYFVYAYLNASSVVTLELSTVSHSTAANGVETKTGDVSRTLVGMIYTSATSQFVDSNADRLCLNWFNRRSISSGQVLSSFTTFTNTAINEINSSLRARFLAWKDEAVFGCVDGYGSNNTVSNNVQVQTYIDGTAFGAALVLTSSTATASGAFSSSGTGFFDDGLHTIQLYGFVNGSQGTIGIGCYAKALTRG